MTIAIVGMVRFWRVLRWLSKSIYRLLTRPFRPRADRAGRATGKARPLPRRERSDVAVKGSLIAAVVLLVASSWFLAAGVHSATNPTQSTAAQIEPAPTTDTQSVTVYITRTGTKYHRNGCRL